MNWKMKERYLNSYGSYTYVCCSERMKDAFDIMGNPIRRCRVCEEEIPRKRRGGSTAVNRRL